MQAASGKSESFLVVAFDFLLPLSHERKEKAETGLLVKRSCPQEISFSGAGIQLGYAACCPHEEPKKRNR